MSIIDSSTKFVGINPDYPTAGLKSAQVNAAQKVVTMQDIIDTVLNDVPSSGGVTSVTGLDTDNTDPLNPIVKVLVDGTTIIGNGTPLSPLQANIPNKVNSVTGVGVDHIDPLNPIINIPSIDGLATEIFVTNITDLKANDSVVVHNIGDETIAGLKTFTDDLTSVKIIKSGGTSNQILMADGSVFEKYKNSISDSNQIETTSNTDVVATGLIFTPPAGTYKIDFNAHYLSIPGNVVEIATIDLQVLKLYLNNLTATGTHGLSFGSGETLTAGVYTVNGAMGVAGVLTLNGGVNDIFVFRADGAINTASFTTIQLTGGVKAANVFFIGNGAVGLGANNVLNGNFIAVGAAAALGADATFNGRLLSTAGSIAFGAGTISKPTDVSLIPLGILESFLSFTTNGGITNTALAIITGNLGTGSASVVVFTGSVFNGVAFDVTQPLGDTNVFSLYQGETQIPHTERFRYYNTYVEDVAMMAIATVDGTETISVRWRTDIGRVILANRIFTIVKI
jgi:hypothetical protein